MHSSGPPNFTRQAAVYDTKMADYPLATDTDSMAHPSATHADLATCQFDIAMSEMPPPKSEFPNGLCEGKEVGICSTDGFGLGGVLYVHYSVHGRGFPGALNG